MNLYLLYQSVVRGYDTYDSCVVVAPDSIAAVSMHPYDGEPIQSKRGDDWPLRTIDITCKYLGEAHPIFDKPAILCASFNAG